MWQGQNEPEQKSKRLLIGVSVASVLLLGGVGYGAYSYFTKPTKVEVKSVEKSEKSKVNTKSDVILQKDVGKDIEIDNSTGYNEEVQKKIDEGTNLMKEQEGKQGDSLTQLSDRFQGALGNKPEIHEGEGFLFHGKITMKQFYIKQTGISICLSSEGEILAFFLDVKDGELNNKYIPVITGENFTINLDTEGSSLGVKLINTDKWDIKQYNAEKYVVYKLNKGVDGLEGGFEFSKTN
ncbi:hypothetical protein [Bacillus toyonensis]|uniref:hypothetical protein n=1 Tax=Bacillus toyonensis TaxID=155322 RepID=UPI000BF6D934|nr:hypothetical protein [Bacillus toyonensis]PGF05222.1 hypothetical protein COM61_02035 [Bacillus toyonensis]